jgi:hypothetical protein
MGTSGSYSGSGGKLGDDLRDNINDWLNLLPSQPPAQPDGEPGHQVDQGEPGQPRPTDQGRPRLDPRALLPVVGLLRPRSPRGGGGDGPGGGGGTRTGGPQRSAAQAASTTGRAGAAAYAYRTGDTTTLERLGLDYAELTALGDPFEIVKRIVDAVCGPRSNSTIEDHEQRLVAADIAEWVLTEHADGAAPAPGEIVRHAIALVIADSVLSETGQIVNESEHAAVAEADIRDAADALAARAELSSTGATEDEFARAIEQGIEALREILHEEGA